MTQNFGLFFDITLLSFLLDTTKASLSTFLDVVFSNIKTKTKQGI